MWLIQSSMFVRNNIFWIPILHSNSIICSTTIGLAGGFTWPTGGSWHTKSDIIRKNPEVLAPARWHLPEVIASFICIHSSFGGKILREIQLWMKEFFLKTRVSSWHDVSSGWHHHVRGYTSSKTRSTPNMLCGDGISSQQPAGQ